MKCSRCGAPTDRIYRLCHDCVRADLARELEEQGIDPHHLPPDVLRSIDTILAVPTKVTGDDA